MKIFILLPILHMLIIPVLVLFLVYSLIALFLTPSITDDEICDAFDMMKIGQTKVVVEKAVKERASFSRKEIWMETPEFSIVKYYYDYGWPFKIFSFTKKYIELKYDQYDKVISKKLSLD